MIESKSILLAKSKIVWTKDTKHIEPSIVLPTTDKVESLMPSQKIIYERVNSSTFDQRIEPVTLIINEDPNQWLHTIKKVAAHEKAPLIYETLLKKKEDLVFVDRKGKTRWLIEKNTLPLIDLSKLRRKFKYTSYQVQLDLSHHAASSYKLKQLSLQLKPFFNYKNWVQIHKRLQHFTPTWITEILPIFPRKFVGKYLPYRGPNCFHSAMAFQNPNYVKALGYNAREEVNYHRAMINYDELWWALQEEFYEVNPKTTPLKYGDVIVFMEVPVGMEKGPVYYKWIRHTTTYILNRYTFTKGSKSANSPYMIKTIDGEWKAWSRRFENMAFKVFRKNSKSVTIPFIRKLSDWLF